MKHPEPDFYTVGMKRYGRAPTFLLLIGYEQMRSLWLPSPATGKPLAMSN